MIKNSPYTEITHPLFAEQHFHIYNHANGEHNIFFSAENRRYFLRQYNKYMYDYLHTFAYCLMPNHFHIQVQVYSKAQILLAAKKDFPKGLAKREGINIANFETVTELTDSQASHIVSERLRCFFMSYSKAVNKQQKRRGSLFQKYFRRKPVNTYSYFKGCIAYIHRNPTHHGFVKDWREWEWSSYGRLDIPKETHLQKQRTIAAFGSLQQLNGYHNEYKKYAQDEVYWAID